MQNLSMAAGLAPGAIIPLESTNEEQFSTAGRITKHRTSLCCQQQLTEGYNWCLRLLPDSRVCSVPHCNLLLLGYPAPSP